jgi:hypothetical protein
MGFGSWFTRKKNATPQPGSVAKANANANANTRVRSASNTILAEAKGMNKTNAAVATGELNSLISDIEHKEKQAEVQSGNTNVQKKKLKISGKVIADTIRKANMSTREKLGLFYRLGKLAAFTSVLKDTMTAIQNGTINVDTMNKDLRTIFELAIDDIIDSMRGVGNDTRALESLKTKLEAKRVHNQVRGGGSGNLAIDLLMLILNTIGSLLFGSSSSSGSTSNNTPYTRKNPPRANNGTLAPGQLWDYQYDRLPKHEKHLWKLYSSKTDPAGVHREVYMKY